MKENSINNDEIQWNLHIPPLNRLDVDSGADDDSELIIPVQDNKHSNEQVQRNVTVSIPNNSVVNPIPTKNGSSLDRLRVQPTISVQTNSLNNYNDNIVPTTTTSTNSLLVRSSLDRLTSPAPYVHVQRVNVPTTNSTATPLQSQLNFAKKRAKSKQILGYYIPSSFKQAKMSPQWADWKVAMDKEMQSIDENDTWELVPRPKHMNVIGSRWVYDLKVKSDGTIERHKARFVARGFNQTEESYQETFAATLKHKSLRLFLHLINEWDYEFKQMDVNNAFLYGPMNQELYMEQPEGYHYGGDGDDRDLVCKLKKCLYGTKQAAHEWFQRLKQLLVSKLHFQQLKTESCLYTKISQTGKLMLIGTFVDDILIGYSKEDELEWLQLKKQILDEFKMKDLGDAQWVLKMKITRDRRRKY